MKNTTSECTPATPQLSHNYSTATGERVGGKCGGVYWIPASQFSSAIERARSDPRVLNNYRFESFCKPRR